MRSNLEADFGKLVRVKTLAIGVAYNPTQNPSEWNKETCFQRYRSNQYCLSELAHKFEIPESLLFNGFNLGNVLTDSESCYVGKITSFILVRNGHFVFLDTKKKIKDFCKLNRKKKYYPIRVGIEFYPGFKKNDDNSYSEVGQRFFKEKNTRIMFFYKDILPIEKLIQYECLAVGNLVLLKRAKGMIIQVNNDSDNAFHLKNSWTTRKVMMLGNSKNPYKQTRLTPDKNYRCF